MTKNSDTPSPLHVEESGLNAWPALQTNLYDGWVMRFANGYTKRANSITPVYAGSMDIAEKIEQCEAIYKRHNQPTIFRLPSFHPSVPELDANLEARGYSVLDETSVQVADIQWASYEENDRVQNMLYPGHWLPTYNRLDHKHGVDQKHRDSETHEQMLKNIVGETGYFVLMDDAYNSVACGLGICQGKYLGLYDIVVGEEHRRKGYGAKLIEALIAWGVQSHDAHYAYLSVVTENTAAINLYARFGFQEIYRYHYRVSKG